MAYPKNRISHKRELYYILCIVAVVIIFLFSFLGPGGYLELYKARADLRERQARVEELKRSNQERRKSIEALRSDKNTLEKYIREKGYGRDDEIVQQLPKEPDK